MHAHRFISTIAAFWLLMLLVSGSSPAQWAEDPDVNLPLATGSGDQTAPRVVIDGAGGYIVAWRAADGIHLQRLDSAGIRLWPPDGVQIPLQGDVSYDISAEPSGGVSCFWMRGIEQGETTLVTVARQWVSGAGVVTPPSFVDTLAYEDGGTFHCLNWGLSADGEGGAIALVGTSWDDETDFNLEASRVESAGTIVWTQYVASTSMPFGGSYLIDWTTRGPGSAFLRGFFGESSSGMSVLWVGNQAHSWSSPGFETNTHTSEEVVAADGSGGVVVAWRRGPWTGGGPLVLQRLTPAGSPVWPTPPVLVRESLGRPQRPRVLPREDGTVFVVWTDNRTGTNTDIRGQKVTSSGTLAWGSYGIGVCTQSANQTDPLVMDDGEGGIFVLWTDRRSGGADLYAQRVDGSGKILWAQGGIPVTSASGDQLAPVCAGGEGHPTLVVWEDLRHGNTDIFGARLASRNAILNPGFEAGVSRWTLFSGGTGTLTAVTPGAVGSHAARIALPAPGPTAQMYQAGITLLPGTPYRLKFRAACASGHDVSVSICKHTAPYTNYGLQSRRADVTGAWKIFTMDFVTTGFTDIVRDARLRFSVGGYAVNGDVYLIDEVVLERRQASDGPYFGADGEGEHRGDLPMQPELFQNYPNPFNPTTVIRYGLPAPGRVSVKVFDLLGREVATLVDDVQEAGYRSVEWKGVTSAGSPVGSGVYFYELRAGSYVETRKMMLIR